MGRERRRRKCLPESKRRENKCVVGFSVINVFHVSCLLVGELPEASTGHIMLRAEFPRLTVLRTHSYFIPLSRAEAWRRKSERVRDLCCVKK